MIFSGRDIARRGSDGQVVVRPEAMRCRVRMGALTTSDSNTLDVAFTFSVRALDEKSERQMLAETFMGRDIAVTVDDVAAHFSPALREALARRVSDQPAEHWLSDASRSELIEALRAAAKPVAFACGVELLPPFELSVESPTLQRVRLEEMQRQLVERRAAGQAEHVHRAAELLKQFQSLRDAMPGLSPGQLLDRVNPADRGTMLETLLLASAGQTAQFLYAVAGPNLLRIDPRQGSPRVDVIPLSPDLGPLRSVQHGGDPAEPRLLVGAQKGVVVVDPAQPRDALQYADPETRSPLGFNSVVACGGMIFASHAEAGIVGWRIGETDRPVVAVRGGATNKGASPPPDVGDDPPVEATTNGEILHSMVTSAPGSSTRLSGAGAHGPRNVCALDDDRILYSVEGQAFVMDRTGQTAPVGGGASIGAAAPDVVLIATDRDRIVVVRSSGFVEWLDRATLTLRDGAQRAGSLCAAAILPWLGSTRLLLASDAGPIACVGVDDTLTTQYASPHRGLRALSATADFIAGLSPNRQRIILWKTWDGRQPAHELHLASIARHRIADLCFG